MAGSRSSFRCFRILKRWISIRAQWKGEGGVDVSLLTPEVYRLPKPDRGSAVFLVEALVDFAEAVG